MQQTAKLNRIDVSAIIPVGARTDDLRELHASYKHGLEAAGVSFEMIYVIDGPRAAEREALLALRARGERLKIVQLAKVFGEATALMVGFANGVGARLLTLPAYFQIEDEEIGKVLAAGERSDVVIARRCRRGTGFDAWRRAGFHTLLKLVVGIDFRDLGCGVRLLQRPVVEEIAIYGEQHRLLPVIAARQGFGVAEVAVEQSPRDRFRGRYRPRDYLTRLLDIFTVFFLARFTKKPLRFFGAAGSVTFGAGALVIGVLFFQRIVLDVPLADRPVLLLSCLLLVLGVQLFALGLLGELIIFSHAKDIKDYKIAHVIEAVDRRRDRAHPPGKLGSDAGA